MNPVLGNCLGRTPGPDVMIAATRVISDAALGVAMEYRRGRTTRAINWWFQRLTKLGVGASYRHILTVTGRKTGQPRSTPVDVIELNGHRWLVAGYGPANWVLNARASGEVELSRGGQTERYKVTEAAADDGVPVLRKYIDEIRVTRPYFDARVRGFIRRLGATGFTVESTPGHYRVLRASKPVCRANGMPFMLPFSPDTIRWRRAAVVELRKLGTNV